MKKDSKLLILVLCLGLSAGLILKLFVIDILHVSGRSMMPAIQDGDTLFVNKLAFGIITPYGEKLLLQWAEPKRGDVVIYLYDNKIVVKRCVAVSGDLLEYSEDSGYSVYSVKVGSSKISLTQEQFDRMKSSQSVPEGYIFAVGDNYEESIDSRSYGFVSVKNILGKVLWR